MTTATGDPAPRRARIPWRRGTRARPGAAAAVIGATLCLLAALAGCSGDGVDSPEELDPVRVVTMPFLSHSPLHIAAHEGYFADEGLAVEFVRLPRTRDIMAALSRGGVDAAGAMPGVGVLNSIAAGEPARLVATLAYTEPDGCSYYPWLTRRELLEAGALEDPDRVRGMRFSANRYLLEAYWLDEALHRLGLTLDDVEVIDLPPAATPEAIRNGAIDVAAVPEPLLTTSGSSDDLAVWLESEDLMPHQAISVVIFGPGFLSERPELGERFIAAVRRGIRQYREGKTPRNVAIVQEFIGLDEEEVRAMCWPTVLEDNRIELDYLRGYQEWAVRRGLLDRVMTADELLDDRFVEAAAERAGSAR